MGTLGVQEMIIVFLVALVLFGPRKLPELGRTIGKAITEFRRASTDLKSTFDREMQNLEQETALLHSSTQSIAGEIHSQVVQSFSYDDPGQSGVAPHELPAANPSTVGVSEVSNAESYGSEHAGILAPEPAAAAESPAAPVAVNGAAPEGTVARGEASSAEAAPAAEPPVVTAATPGTEQHA